MSAAERIIAVGLASPLPMMSGAVPWQGWNTACASPMSAEGAMPMPPIRPAGRSEMMSPDIVSLTTPAEAPGPRHRKAATSAPEKGTGGAAGIARGAFVEHATEKGVGLEGVRLVDAGEEATAATRLAAARQPKREIEQALGGLARDQEGLARFGIGHHALAHGGEQALGRFTDH